jgi:lipopolysaccharide-binding protein
VCKVQGMEVGITMEIKNYNGSLALNVSQCGCYVKDLVISLDGGASWFYQGYALFAYLLKSVQVEIVC